MPREKWAHSGGRPCVQVTLTSAASGQPLVRKLLADTGAGSRLSGFELVLTEADCLACGGSPDRPVMLRGALGGLFPTYVLAVSIPSIGFADDVRAVAVPAVTTGLDGIACFRFLNRFQYGNFGYPNSFGLES